MIAIIAILAAMLLPTLAKAKTKAQGIGCLNNTKQLTLGWHLYSGDFDDRVANNFGVNETITAIDPPSTFDNWVNNVMTWGASGSTADRSNTNTDWVKNGVLGKYTAGAVGVYKCPADIYLSQPQRSASFPQRNRSLSMNAMFGLFSHTDATTMGGTSWGFNQYRQFLKQVQVPKPGKTWLFLDEHPDTINDGYYITSPTAGAWQDKPASYHNGACGFAFADGHSEIRKWLSGTSKYPIKATLGYTPADIPWDLAGRADGAWYAERTGYVFKNSGLGDYGY